MNIQIFALKKNFDVQKAERYFKERRIPCQFIDLGKRGMSPRELESVCRSVGLEALVHTTDSDWESHYVLQLQDRREALRILSEKPELLNTPIVRNGPQATVGYHPEIWEKWS
ncbi:MAG: ArsC family transcriptional regulator [Clostridia bacterium]|nr:ArsC family transcriptional regulator [Clostridia bacterium]